MNKKAYEIKAKKRFEAKYRVNPTGCWEWLGKKNAQGYGVFSYHCRTWGAHRYSYLVHTGPLEAGKHLDHLCKNVACVNPAHLEQVTPKENRDRSDNWTGVNTRKTQCKRGHLLTPENLQIKNGHRICLECRKLYNKDTYARLYSSAANGGTCKATVKKYATG